MCLLFFTGDGNIGVTKALVNVQESGFTIWFPTQITETINTDHVNTLLQIGAEKIKDSVTRLTKTIDGNTLTKKVRKNANNALQPLSSFNPFQEDVPATLDHVLKYAKKEQKFSSLDQIDPTPGRFIKKEVKTDNTKDTKMMNFVECIFDSEQLLKMCKDNKYKTFVDMNAEFMIQMRINDEKKSLYLSDFWVKRNDFKIAVNYTEDNSGIRITETRVFIKSENLKFEPLIPLIHGNYYMELSLPKNTKIFWGAPRTIPDL
jgi:hypothetical protein